MKLSDHHIAILRRDLESRRRQLEAELAHFETWSMAQLGFGHALVDDASAAFDQATQLTLRQNTERLLAQALDALARLEAGAYGLCEGCGQAIDLERLQAVIDARHCLGCQRRQERSPFARANQPRPAFAPALAPA